MPQYATFVQLRVFMTFLPLSMLKVLDVSACALSPELIDLLAEKCSGLQRLVARVTMIVPEERSHHNPVSGR